ncbi:MAG: hypothetical protein ACMXYE_05610 [Candidatus Woesearchaeota archaeon]
MSYYIHRLKEQSEKALQVITFEFAVKPHENDEVVVISPVTHIVLGIYQFRNNKLILLKTINQKVSFFYEKLPMVTDINERTYKLFAKVLREISRDDFIVFEEYSQ